MAMAIRQLWLHPDDCLFPILGLEYRSTGPSRVERQSKPRVFRGFQDDREPLKLANFMYHKLGMQARTLECKGALCLRQ